MSKLSQHSGSFSARKCLAGIFSLAVVVGGALLATPARASGPELIVNGSFEADGWQWSGGNITGWTKVSGSVLEIAASWVYGVYGQNGDLVLELSGDWPNPQTRIKQTVATVPGRTYKLSFLGGARDGGWYGDTINVYWGGAHLDTVNPTSALMQRFTYSVTATGTSMDVEFEGGEYDTVGSIIDDVSLKADIYDLCLLYDPAKLHKSGSTIPIKLQLCEDGSNASSSGITLHAVSVQKIGDAGSGTPEDSGSANPDADFRYDATLGGYVFNLSTKGLASGTYLLNFKVVGKADTYSVEFRIK